MVLGATSGFLHYAGESRAGASVWWNGHKLSRFSSLSQRCNSSGDRWG